MQSSFVFRELVTCASRRLLSPPSGQFQVTLTVKITDRESSKVVPPAQYSARAGWRGWKQRFDTYRHCCQAKKGRSHRPCTLIQSSTNEGYVTNRLSTVAQCRAGLQQLGVSRKQSYFHIQGCYLNRKKPCKLSLGAFWLPPGLFLYPVAWVFGLIKLKHAHADMYDPRPCQGISPLLAPVHTAGRQLGSNASACLQRFSLCFTLHSLVKHTHMAFLAVCWTPRECRWSALGIIMCVNCVF